MEVVSGCHLVQTSANSSVDNADAQNPEESAKPEWNDADAYMWTYNIHDPVWG